MTDTERKDGAVTGSKNLISVENAEQPKLPYPKRIFFIIGNEFCERFNYYGMKTILVIYATKQLGFTDNDATVLYHTFAMFNYFMCIFGGILSDAWLGKFKTIFYLSLIYVVGSGIVSFGAIPDIGISPKFTLYIGLLLIAIGSGGIKPCVAAFGGDQFKLPEQAVQATRFFSVFYFSINAGSLISTSLTPILREEVHCFGQNSCYSLAFGVPAALMVVSVVFFMVGRTSYTYVESNDGNMLLKMCKCITNAITMKIRERKTNPRKNILDYSVEQYGQKLVDETRIMLKILVLYLPLPFFWTLFDQQGSRWSLQATRMNGDLGFYKILPDQMQMINPLLILLFIPAFEAAFYPLLSKIGIRSALQKLTLGGIFAGVAFLFSAFVENLIVNSPEKSVNMLWQVPQFTIITLGEVMFSVTLLSFSYEEAPESMKSVVQSFWLLTVAIGNVIVIVLSEAKIFESQVYELILFGVLMFIDMFIFAILAVRYKRVQHIPTEVKNYEQNITLNSLVEKTSF